MSRVHEQDGIAHRAGTRRVRQEEPRHTNIRQDIVIDCIQEAVLAIKTKPSDDGEHHNERGTRTITLNSSGASTSDNPTPITSDVRQRHVRIPSNCDRPRVHLPSYGVLIWRTFKLSVCMGRTPRYMTSAIASESLRSLCRNPHKSKHNDTSPEYDCRYSRSGASPW